MRFKTTRDHSHQSLLATTPSFPSQTLVLLGLALAACTGQRSESADALQQLLDSVRIELEAPGAILGVHFPNDTVQVFASGLADIDANQPIQPDDAYFLGSISKTYTAAAVLRLAENGQLTLDDPVSRFLPDFPRGNEITVHHLLTHTSGLRDFYSYLYFRPDRDEMIEFVTKPWTQQEVMDLIERFGHSFEPGEDWAYSNTNYYLLGIVIEQSTGNPLAESYQNLIFDPLDIQKTWLTFHEPERAPLNITGYMGQTDAWQHSEMFGDLGATTILDRSPVEWGAGGLAGPAEDVLDFMNALMNNRLVSPQSISQMQMFRQTPPLGMGGVAPDVSSGYGLGLVTMQRDRYTVIGHGGLFTGHTAGMWYVPECDLTIALFFNRGFVGQRRALDRFVPAIAAMKPSTTACIN